MTWTNPIRGIGGDDIHVASDEGEDLGGVGAGVLGDDVAPAVAVADVADDEGAAAGGGADWQERVEHVAGHAVLFGDEIWGVVLHVLRLADDLREEGHVGVAIEWAQILL